MNGWETLAVATVSFYNLAILGVTTYLVWNGWSPWWFLGAACLLKSIRTGKAAECDCVE